MSYTNTTSHYSLPQYVGSDKPKYLTDFNGAMATIDGQMYDNATAAATADSKADAAQSTADANTSSISALNTQINGDSGLAADVAANQGAITTISSLIGNGEPTTTDKTIIGAINELNADIVTPSTGIDARLTAAEGAIGDLSDLDTTVKTSLVAAVNEVAGPRVIASVTSDGVKTNGQLLSDLYAAAPSMSREVFARTKLIVAGLTSSPYLKTDNKLEYVSSHSTVSGLDVTTFTLQSTSAYTSTAIALDGTVTVSDGASYVQPVGVTFEIII